MSSPNDSSSPPTVRDRTVPPSGILHRHAQAWVLGGISLLMVLVFAFSGRTPERKTPETPPVAPTDPNRVLIQDYRARIEEQSRKLAIEQAQLQLAKQSASGMVGTGAPSGSYAAGLERPERGAPSGAPGYSSSYTTPPEKSWIQTDLEKRTYQSLFASNIVSSLRNPNEGESDRMPATLTETPSAPPQTAYRPDSSARTLVDKKNEADYATDPNDVYKIAEGTVIEAVLNNRLDSSFSGPVNCMVTTSVYSHDRQHLLVPQGSRLLGEAKRVEDFGQTRLAVIFHKLILPNERTVTLDKFQGLNQIGETGLRDQVNHHYLQIFGVSLALGAFAGFAQQNTHYGLDSGAGDAYRQGLASSLSQSALRILDRYLSVLPTHTIREGHRVKVYLSGDLSLPAYKEENREVER